MLSSASNAMDYAELLAVHLNTYGLGVSSSPSMHTVELPTIIPILNHGEW